MLSEGAEYAMGQEILPGSYKKTDLAQEGHKTCLDKTLYLIKGNGAEEAGLQTAGLDKNPAL